MKLYILLPVFLLASGTLFAQNSDTSVREAANLSQAFHGGKLAGQFRNIFMVTNNRKGLSDYYANAVGGGLKFETAPFHKLQLGISGSFIFNTGSSDLSLPDKQTGQYNRYEIGLFDLEDPRNRNDMDRMEEIYLTYKTQKAHITAGKQLIQTPFINPQDSRMRPTVVEGVYGTLQVHEKLSLEGGFLYRISPRSTKRWFSLERSIGVNSQGVNIDGSPGDYAMNLKTAGVALLGGRYQVSKTVQVKWHNLFVQNISNTLLLEPEYKKTVGELTYTASLQYIHQQAVNRGGNKNRSQTYFDPANTVNIVGAKAAVEKKGWEASVNYTRITRSGRFTMPREWGTEPLFTVLSRERAEGLGDVHAVMARVKGGLPQKGMKAELAYGHYYLPDVANAALNKYGTPSYRHLKALLQYELPAVLNGLEIALLYVHKGQLGDRVYQPKYILNKVGMQHYTAIVNFHF